jgi:hypothetical protein
MFRARRILAALLVALALASASAIDSIGDWFDFTALACCKDGGPERP